MKNQINAGSPQRRGGRRVSKSGWVALIFLLALGWSVSAQTTWPAISGVIRIGVTVEDMDRSVEFYTHVLDFKKTSDIEVAGEEYEKLSGVFGMRVRIVRLGLGEETFELTQYLTPRGRVVPRDSRSNDRWFQHIAIVTTNMDRAYARLREGKVRFASTGPQRLPEWNKNAGGIRAFYFRDPDDHVLEVIWFPPGKGDGRWQKSKELFAGIDHTAIVVANTGKALGFYRDVLGMKVAGESENYGTEQEHLNNVEGARLKITSMRAAKGPGVEFLEYVTPGGGRAFPPDARANDLFYWQTVVLCDDLAGMVGKIGECVEGQIVKGVFEGTGFDRGARVRDVDGHFLMVVEK